MIAIAVFALMLLGSMGGGALALKSLGVLDEIPRPERCAWSFAIGFGVLGWLMFFPAVSGILSPAGLATATAAGTPGLWLLRSCGWREGQLDRWGWALVAVAAVLASFDLIEALAPPADADSLAYHFAIPKLIMTEGRLNFVPRAVDGAIPLLVQMTYVPALILGGERAVTLWVMASGWGAAFLVFVICRRRLAFAPSLAAALVWQSIPAVIAAAGTGQIEVRLALFATAGAFAVADARTTGSWRMAALAGMTAGFFAAGKYPGLIFAFAAGLILVTGRSPWRNAAAFATAAALAGCQWYGWNYVHTGDPVFPMLFGILPYRDETLWNAAQHAYLASGFFQGEKILPQNPLWMLLYPLHATVLAEPVFESGRTGPGPALLLFLPFVLAGAFQRLRKGGSRLLTPVLIVLLAYAIWYLFGPSQRIRHLVPFIPILVIAAAAALSWAAHPPLLRTPIIAAVVVCLGIQGLGATVYAVNYIRHFATDKGRNDFLEHNVPAFDMVPWLNTELRLGERVLLDFRQLNYLLDVGYFYLHRYDQMEVQLGIDPASFWRQLRAKHITHVATHPVENEMPNGPPISALAWLGRALVDRGCAEVAAHLDLKTFTSRTLSGGTPQIFPYEVLRLTPDTCSLTSPY